MGDPKAVKTEGYGSFGRVNEGQVPGWGSKAGGG